MRCLPLSLVATFYAHREVIVETDHKALETILKKPIQQSPLRLQKMILRTKPYALNVKYIPGSHLILADALSRASLPIEPANQPDEFEINLSYGHVSETMLQKLTAETGEDLEQQ